jgi:gluconate 2-dehydrogenase gamma chain
MTSTDGDESVSSVDQTAMARRDALKAMAAGIGALPILDAALPAQQGTPTAQPPSRPTLQPPVRPRGDAWDPDLLHPRPGTWPRKLSAGELITLSVLCDTIMPADHRSPAASAVGVPAWINEYVSYEGNQNALVRVQGGLMWLNLESNTRFGRPFPRLTAAERSQICDDICYLPNAKPEFRSAALFFDQVRDLTAVGYYTTREGMQDLGYIGNVALPEFPEVSAEIRRKIGV